MVLTYIYLSIMQCSIINSLVVLHQQELVQCSGSEGVAMFKGCVVCNAKAEGTGEGGWEGSLAWITHFEPSLAILITGRYTLLNQALCINGQLQLYSHILTMKHVTTDLTDDLKANDALPTPAYTRMKKS